ncbi:MAG: hypothetical protein CL607_02950 [Anaerolineaceae bacterium]|nr:hypothetical protein [Anaerolineaceae bacterium]
MQPVSQQMDGIRSQHLGLGLGLMMLAMTVGAILVLSQIRPPGSDFQVYYATGSKWTSGQTQLYDAASRNFFNAPWTLLVIAPISQLPVDTAVSALATLSIACLGVSLWLLTDSRPTPIMVLQLATMPVIYLLLTGQIDTISLLGVAIAYWAHRRQKALWLGVGFVLMLVKPTNLVLAGTVLLLGMRKWSWINIAKAIGVPMLFVIASGFVVGFDWITRYIENYQAFEPIDNGTSTLWKWLDSFGVDAKILLIPLAIVLILILWRHTLKYGLSDWGLATALATQFVFTPYAWVYHYVALLPVQVYLTRRHWTLGLLVYGVAWLPAGHLIANGQIFGTSDVLIPLLMGVLCWGLYFSGQRQATDEA